MFATFFAKFGRRIIMWAVIAIASALARKVLDRWASGDHPIETTGSAAE